MKKTLLWTFYTLVTISVTYWGCTGSQYTQATENDDLYHSPKDRTVKTKNRTHQDATGQTILKKKDLIARLDQISTDIQNKDFEKAMLLFDSKQEIISEENVPKKALDQYKTIKTVLDQKKTEFNSNREKINAYQKQYNSMDYCSAIDLLGLSLTKENSYKETQDVQSKLTSSLKEAKQKCEDNGNKLQQWKKDYNNQEYEKLYQLLEISSYEKKYFYGKDLSELETLQKDLKDKYSTYNNIKYKILTTPERTINDINFNTLTYEESERYIQQLSTLLSVSNSELQKLQGKNPILLKEFAELKPKIERTIVQLKEYSETNRPLTLTEIYSVISNQKPITLEFLKKHCYNIDEYSCEMIEYATKDLWAANVLDVVDYFNLNEKYDTELKRKVFRGTQAGTDFLTKLKQIKQDHRRTVFVIELADCRSDYRNHSISDYDISKKRFEINIGDAICFTTPHTEKLDESSILIYRPPKTIYDFDVSKLPINRKVESKVIFTNYAEYIQIPVSEQVALNMENNKIDIRVFILTDIIGTKKVTYNRYWCSWIKQNKMKTLDVFTNSFVRLIIANDQTGEIYFDKVYL